MRKLILFALILSLGLVSCKGDDPIPVTPSKAEHTLFMYMPWSTNLLSDFRRNIEDFETALNSNLLRNNRLIVFLSSSSTKAAMFELKYEKGILVRDTLKEYPNPVLTTETGITTILNDVTYFAEAKRYSMIIGSHGMGWLPAGVTSRGINEKYHWEYEGVPSTRFFGGDTPDTHTNITTLAKGIANTGIKMDYILFDGCYMSSIELAYDLKEVTSYIIACPTELMSYGFPYHTIGKFLIGDFDLRGICDGFYNFYSNYKENGGDYPYGTIAVTVTAELDNLVTVMKKINQTFSFDPALLSEVQRMDGYSPVIFFDMGDYVSKLCTDNDLLFQFETQLERAVPSRFKRYTSNYYSTVNGIQVIDIRAFSGVTISDPSTHRWATTKAETAWYKATH